MSIRNEIKNQPNYNMEDIHNCLPCDNTQNKLLQKKKSIICIHEGCKVQPTYNINGETMALYCSAHKLDGMVDVKHKTCIHDNCKVRPTYNIEGETNALYCLQHKKDGNVNVISKTCIHPECKVRPSYNTEGKKTTLYCLAHKLDGMVNVKHKSCKTYLCLTLVQQKYDGYCLFCYINIFPDKPVSRNYKTKEYSVVEYVKSKYPTLIWAADKIIQSGCSKRRPDLLLDLGDQIIIVEVDENQHTDYDCSCENKRIMELSQDLGHRPIVFIRFNPDDYDKNGANITSCWGRDKKGICVVKKTKKDEWMQRLHVLEEQINYWIINRTDKTIETIQLFYDV